jgi:hypothetical protein
MSLYLAFSLIRAIYQNAQRSNTSLVPGQAWGEGFFLVFLPILLIPISDFSIRHLRIWISPTVMPHLRKWIGPLRGMRE